MIAKNLLVTLLGFLVALTAYFNVQSGIKEDFLGLSGIRGVALPQRVVDTSNRQYGGYTPDTCHKSRYINSTPERWQKSKRGPRENFTSNNKFQGPPTYTVPGTYQSNIAPRFQPQQYSANISYNAPPSQYLGVPTNPLGYASEVQQPTFKENFGHKNNQTSSASIKLDASAPLLPNPNMKQGNQNANFVVDRFYTAIAKSPMLAGSDYIRGSLAVIPEPPPCLTQAWGKPSYAYNPTNSLNVGALNVLGGLGSEQATALNTFVQQSSGGSVTVVGGEPVAPLQSTAIGASMARKNVLSAARKTPNDTVTVTAF